MGADGATGGERRGREEEVQQEEERWHGSHVLGRSGSHKEQAEGVPSYLVWRRASERPSRLVAQFRGHWQRRRRYGSVRARFHSLDDP